MFSMSRSELQEALSEALDLNYRYMQHCDELLTKLEEYRRENVKILGLANEYRVEVEKLNRTIHDLIANSTLGGIDEYESLDFPTKPK
jgi:hypothetical protein